MTTQMKHMPLGLSWSASQVQSHATHLPHSQHLFHFLLIRLHTPNPRATPLLHDMLNAYTPHVSISMDPRAMRLPCTRNPL